jgi:hypothetical protein
MTGREFCRALDGHPDARLHWMPPDKSFVPAHCHITEVGRVQKDFIDCGGTVRSVKACVLQVWVAGDVDHRLETGKPASIMRVAGPLLQSDELPVEVEREEGVISRYPLGGMGVAPSGLLLIPRKDLRGGSRTSGAPCSRMRRSSGWVVDGERKRCRVGVCRGHGSVKQPWWRECRPPRQTRAYLARVS